MGWSGECEWPVSYVHTNQARRMDEEGEDRWLYDMQSAADRGVRTQRSLTIAKTVGVLDKADTHGVEHMYSFRI